MCLIYEAEEKDLRIISELERDLFFEEKWSYFQILREFKNDFSKILVFKEKEEIIGYLIFREIEPEIEILKIGVRKEYQRKGVGTKLMQKLIEIAKEKNISKIFLEVKASNLSAYNFYKKLGFKEMYRRKNYYGNEEAIVMVKEI
ncbi:ribosomal-protein-alanine acetyltransferase [Thermodesulfobacterium geofontis OPF15]|jgi:ribosomal-protein-alanine N-acetyltransferase|uniref:[Ribosomal protein bS18]-alanine N-acetyltransferase n=1 Tax=Thermodesulfobacterium geofontis (strain OPF15) TaxID=795359 RepID=F8C2R4_THEGP|nr:ribosomal protein S18-alanine N-acetyltransferase [Thermodesulfobacterium geofontis]AEH23468.1 ribosomal-protein-alanine acetyltransferase [Thermodesulfobacterium geofontis OPF15]